MLVWRFNYRGELVKQEVPDNVVKPRGKVGDEFNLFYNRIWSEHFPPDAELVAISGYYGDPWFRDWPHVGPSPAPYTMLAVKVVEPRELHSEV